jgi:hypothetical protein
LGMGFPEGRGVLLIGRRGGSRRACPRDGRAKSPAEMRLRCERRGEGVGADMRARRGSGRAGRVRDERVAGAARAGAGSGERWATREGVRPAGQEKCWAAWEKKTAAGVWAQGKERDGPAGFWVLEGFCWVFISFLNPIQTKFEFKFEFEFKPHSNKIMHQHECNKNLNL